MRQAQVWERLRGRETGAVVSAACRDKLARAYSFRIYKWLEYVWAPIISRLGERVSILRISKPLKEQYAKVKQWRKCFQQMMVHIIHVHIQAHNLHLERLLDASPYKETHRKDMIRWGEEKRAQDPGYFCRLASEGADKPVWLVCDARRPTDMDYFKSLYSCVTVRVVASEDVRRERGWVWVEGVDDAPSECALDSYSCDWTVRNEGEESRLSEDLGRIRQLALGRTAK